MYLIKDIIICMGTGEGNRVGGLRSKEQNDYVRTGLVNLVRVGRDLQDLLSRESDSSAQAARNWIAKADRRRASVSRSLQSPTISVAVSYL